MSKARSISFIRYQAPAIIWAALIYTASSVPSGRLGWWLLHRVDKLIHLGIFYILGLLVYRALHGGSGPSVFSYKRIILMLFIVIGYGLTDEMHQWSTPGRQFDVKDLLADAAGGMLAALTMIFQDRLARRRSHRA